LHPLASLHRLLNLGCIQRSSYNYIYLYNFFRLPIKQLPSFRVVPRSDARTVAFSTSTSGTCDDRPTCFKHRWTLSTVKTLQAATIRPVRIQFFCNCNGNLRDIVAISSFSPVDARHLSFYRDGEGRSFNDLLHDLKL
jgi:hypothetical protein